MKLQEPTITISIPTFNRRDLIGKTLNSVFSQTEKPDEIIVVDDCSSDGTWEYLKKIKGIKVYRNKHNLGMIENWNQSIKLATKDYVVSLHSDDLLLPNYIKTWKEKMRNIKEEIGAFVWAGYNIGINDKVIGLYMPKNKDKIFSRPHTIRGMWDNSVFYVSVTGWTVYNKAIFDKIGYFTDNYRIAAENEMTMKIASKYSIYYCSSPEFAFRRHLLQGFSGGVKEFNEEQEIKNIEDGFQVLRDYEGKKFILSSFPNEKNDRLFVRKPVAFLFIQSFYMLLKLRFDKAKKYYSMFYKYYPKPIFSTITIRLIIFWIFMFIRQFLINLYFSRLSNRLAKV